MVSPSSDSKSNHPREFGPGHPYWPCPICAGLRPSSVSSLIRAKHDEHAMSEPVVDEDDFRLACRLVYDWHANSDGSDPELIDRITMAIGFIRSGGDA